MLLVCKDTDSCLQVATANTGCHSVDLIRD